MSIPDLDSLSIKVGDRAIISGENDTIYVITDIEESYDKVMKKITLYDLDTDESIDILYNGYKWFYIDDESINDILEIKFSENELIDEDNDSPSTGNLFTGSDDLNIEILSIMDNESLTMMCRTSKYFAHLCNMEEMWRRRTIHFYPDAIKFKEDNDTWRTFYKKLNMISNDIGGANLAAEYGFLSVLKYLASMNPPIYINEEGIFDAVEYCHLDVLKWLSDIDDTFALTLDHLEVAIEQGCLDIFKSIMNNKTDDPFLYLPRDFIFYDSEKLIKIAIKYGRLEMMILLLEKYQFMTHDINTGVYNVLADDDTINLSNIIDEVRKSGHLDVIKWVYYNVYNDDKYSIGHYNIRMLRTRIIINSGKNGYLDILDWVISVSESPKENVKTIIFHGVIDNRVEVIKWGLEKYPDLMPNPKLANEARKHGNLQVLKFFKSLNPPILPDKNFHGNWFY